MRAVLSLSLAVLGPWLLAFFVGRIYLSSLCRAPAEEASSSALLVEATPLLLSLVAAALPYVLFAGEGKGGRARAVLFTVLLLGAALCVWLLLSAAHGLKDRGQMAVPGNTTGEVDALRESQHVLGLLYPSSVARLEELALRPLQENFLRREQLQLFLELRQTLDKLPEKQDERSMKAIKTFADILRSALLAPGAYLSCKRPWTLSERVVLSLMAPSAVRCTQESTDLLEGLVREQLRARSGDRGSLLHAQCSVRFMRVVAGHAPGQESTMDALEACEEHLRFASLRAAESNGNGTLSAKEKSRDREDLVRVVGLYASLSLGDGSLQDALALRLGLLLRDYIARFGGAPAAEVLPFFLGSWGG